MKIAILGYGKEGQSAERYFRQADPQNELQIFDKFTPADLDALAAELAGFDLVLRSPSVPPRAEWSSTTKYFFAHCPCPIIGVTGTKGKGTTCSMINVMLQALGYKTWLVGNIGTPALDVLNEIKPNDVVIYELSSFQLWDLDRSPHIAAVLRIEPDHLNIHGSFENYTAAKANIARWQTDQDTCIFYAPNPDSARIAKLSAGHRLPYPVKEKTPELEVTIDALVVPGAHNRENAEAALLAVASFLGLELNTLLEQHAEPLKKALHNFQGLPHRIQFLRNVNGVDYYDDTFSTTPPALQVALRAFPGRAIIPIIGGRDKTNNADLPDIAKMILRAPQLIKVVLIGESGHDLAKILPPNRYLVAESLEEAVQTAKEVAEQYVVEKPVVLMSPTAASFDMFKNEFDRGEQYQRLIQEL